MAPGQSRGSPGSEPRPSAIGLVLVNWIIENRLRASAFEYAVVAALIAFAATTVMGSASESLTGIVRMIAGKL